MTVPEGGVLDAPLHPDTKAVNEIALTLGRPRSWSAVADHFEEIARAIAATGRPRPHADSDSEGVRDLLDQFGASHPRVNDDDIAARDWQILNDLVVELSGAEWNSDTLEHVAGVVGETGRPHPGGSLHGRAYETSLAFWSGEGPRLPSGTLVIKVDDHDLADNLYEPWTASAFWQQENGESDVIGVGGGATIPAALRGLALELEINGVFRAPSLESIPDHRGEAAGAADDGGETGKA